MILPSTLPPDERAIPDAGTIVPPPIPNLLIFSPGPDPPPPARAGYRSQDEIDLDRGKVADICDRLLKLPKSANPE